MLHIDIILYNIQILLFLHLIDITFSHNDWTCSNLPLTSNIYKLLIISLLQLVEGTPIVGGVQAIPKQFPYQVRLNMDKESTWGGALISNRWILTAAHCLHQ